MKAYPEYKSSGIDWLGDIPSHWNIIKGAWCCSFQYGFPADSKFFSIERKGIPLIRIRDLFSCDTEVFYDNNDYTDEYIINNGDILIGMDGDFNVAKWKGGRSLLNQRVCKFDKSFFLKRDFIFYVLPIILKEINNIKYSTTVKHLSAQDLAEMRVPIPPIAEQEAIAAYLDDVVGKIDTLISEKRKLVEDIRAYRTSLVTETVTRGLNPDAPLRPSGINWLGDIPCHWKIVRLGLLFNAKAGGDAKPELYSSQKDLLHPFPVFTNSQVENQVYAYTSEAPFKSGSITVTGRGDIGRAFLRKEDFDAIIRLIVLSPINKVDCNYYKYFIDTVIPFLSDSAAVGQLSASQITKYLLAVPPIAEQQAIADFLDAKTAKIDEMISGLTKQIDELAEYKQAVITEAVTGKVDVRDYKPSN